MLMHLLKVYIPFMIASTTLLCVLTLLYHGSVAQRDGRKGWLEFITTILAAVGSTILLVNNVMSKSKAIYIYPTSVEYVLNASQEKSWTHYTVENGLIALGFILAVENSMSTMAHFRPWREGLPLHHEFTWGVCARRDGFIASIMIVILASGMACDNKGNWNLDLPVLVVAVIAAFALVGLMGATIKAAYNRNQKTIPLYVNAMKILVVQIPNIVVEASSINFAPEALAAWVLSLGGNLLALYLGVKKMFARPEPESQPPIAN
jgi:hypothetical protein